MNDENARIRAPLSPSEIRARLRRLCESDSRLCVREDECEKDLRRAVRFLASRMSLLSVRSGPEAGELFRASRGGVKFETTLENFDGASCLQLRAYSASFAQLGRLMSYLTSPQTDEIERAIQQAADSLCLYANVRLRRVRVSRTCRRLRDRLRQEENARSQQSASLSAVSRARCRSPFYSSYSFRHAKRARENTQKGTQHPEEQV